MPETELLLTRAEEFARTLTRVIREGKRILVVTHIDADGLTSGCIAFQSLARKGASASVRAIPDMDKNVIRGLKAEGFDFFLFTDLASTLLDELSLALGDSYIVVDHHQLSPEDRGHPRLLNAWSFGFDGGTEACSSTMAYMLAKSLDDSNTDLSFLPVVGAMGDRQDSGPGHSLHGLNRKVLDDAVAAGLVQVSNDFLLYGRETRPIHEAVALTYSPFIPGLSGSKDSALAALSNSGLKLKEGGRWRTLSELNSNEKQVLLDVIAKYAGQSENGSKVVSDIIGEVYTLEALDPFTPMRDAREFSTLLNACGRMDRTDVGLSVCTGDAENNLSAALKIASEYRGKISKAIQLIESENDKIVISGDLALVVGDEFLEERLTGSISSILASALKFKDKVVMVRAKSGESELKISTRVGEGYSKSVNLGLLMREAAEVVGGVGGGHQMAAGAKIPSPKGDEFARIVVQRVSS